MMPPAGGGRNRVKPMRVMSKKKLREFWQAHPDAEAPLADWYKVVKAARWAKFAVIRATFRSADLVGRCVVFDTGGNKYRLIATLSRGWVKVYVRHVLTHREYDRGSWKGGYE
jgi:mRNA interferase HigB